MGCGAGSPVSIGASVGCTSKESEGNGVLSGDTVGEASAGKGVPVGDGVSAGSAVGLAEGSTVGVATGGAVVVTGAGVSNREVPVAVRVYSVLSTNN